MDEVMCYVAEDPQQPGAAWAGTVINPTYAKDTAKEVAKWIKSGANVMRVNVATARVMMAKWQRPAKKQATLF